MLTTLTTDFGDQDFYAAALKGSILSRCAEANLIDVSHRVAPLDIVEAAFFVRNVWPKFPPATVHVIAVHVFYASKIRYLALKKEGQIFLAPDNGVLSLLFEKIENDELRELDFEVDKPFSMGETFAAAIAHLSKNLPFETVGMPVKTHAQRIAFQPVESKNSIRGTVIHVDHFENATLNIPRETFEKVGRGRPFSLFFKRNDPIQQLSSHYADATVGEPMCLFNSAGLLEIAVSMGRAASLLGLKKEDIVQVDFH